MNFNQAFKITLRHEVGNALDGAYHKDPNDSGGETKYGISKKAYPKVDIKNLTEAQAKDIYEQDYWHGMKLDSIYQGVRLLLFDIAVNMGVKAATRLVQEVCDGVPRAVAVDGILGQRTREAINNYPDKADLYRKIIKKRVEYYLTISNPKSQNAQYKKNAKFFRNWVIRSISYL